MEQRMRLNGLAVNEATVEDCESSARLEEMVPQQFAVHDRDTAEWLVRRIVEANAHIDRVKHQADREIRRTQQERDFLLMRYGRQLECWTECELQKHKGRRKSVLLLSGTVGFRQVGAKLVVDDQSAVIKWAKRFCRSAVVTVERLSRTELKNHLTATGEIPAGALLEAASQKFYVK
jgi:hypothetical protein